MFKRKLIGHIAAYIMLLIRMTCRVKYHNDPRPALKKQKKSYIYCILHGQQMAAIMGREKKTGAMVSRSMDGEILIPALKIRGVIPYRGSSNKGGMQAFGQMLEHSKKGLPTYFAVDGPRGPRGYVQRGIADLAVQANAAVLVTMALPTKRWILHKAWDRFQIPKFFSRIDVTFAEPLYPEPGENALDFRTRINNLLYSTEQQYDPAEAEWSTTEKGKTGTRKKRDN